MADPVTRVEGLKELRRDARKLDSRLDDEITAAMAAFGEAAVAASRPFTPWAEKRVGRSVVQKHLRDASGVRVLRNAVKLVNPLPYANLVSWGGATPSKSSAAARSGRERTHFPARPFLMEGAEAAAETFGLAELENRIDTALRAAGWR